VPKSEYKDPNDYISPLIMNGLHGRMLRLPPPKGKTRDILFIYGMHASIERVFGLAEFLNKYGSITVPDLPGMGGMEPFYKIGLKPSIDNMADYLAAFIKLKYRRRKITIMAMSLGFPIVTRMLQRFPDIAKKVELLVSVVGFVHHEEFVFSRRNFLMFRYTASVLSNRLPSFMIKHLALRPSMIRATYNLSADRNVKMRDANEVERKERIDFEINLWQINDIRTYMDNGVTMLTLDLCKQQVDLPVHHISVAEDRYFNNHIVEQHLGVIYSKVSVIKAHMKQHAPTVIADAKAASELVPPKLRRLLNAKSLNKR
jgi:pimeloyl-ACP methyl ester carboxylesterase